MYDSRVGIHQREGHVGRLVDLILIDVGLAELMARERGPTTRAVRDHLQVLIEEPLVEDGLELPPDALDIVGRERPVRIVEVGPVADPLGERPPVIDIADHRLLAQARELGDADLVLDLLLARDPQSLLDFHLDGQAVGVPSAATGHVVAPHRLKAAEEVLVRASPDVVEPGTTVRRRGALIEDPWGRARSVGHRPLEDLLGAPARPFLGFNRDKVDLRTDRAEHRVSFRRRSPHTTEASTPACGRSGVDLLRSTSWPRQTSRSNRFPLTPPPPRR